MCITKFAVCTVWCASWSIKYAWSSVMKCLACIRIHAVCIMKNTNWRFACRISKENIVSNIKVKVLLRQIDLWWESMILQFIINKYHIFLIKFTIPDCPLNKNMPGCLYQMPCNVVLTGKFYLVICKNLSGRNKLKCPC